MLNEVRKDAVTAAEIHVLRAMHGTDAVLEITHVGQAKGRTDGEERERLHLEYGAGLSRIDEIKSLNGIFGVMGVMPEAMQGVTHLKAGAAPKNKPKEVVKEIDDDIELATEEDLNIPDLEDA